MKKKDKTKNPIQPVSGTKVPRFSGPSTFARLPEIRDVKSCDVATFNISYFGKPSKCRWSSKSWNFCPTNGLNGIFCFILFSHFYLVNRYQLILHQQPLILNYLILLQKFLQKVYIIPSNLVLKKSFYFL